MRLTWALVTLAVVFFQHQVRSCFQQKRRSYGEATTTQLPYWWYQYYSSYSRSPPYFLLRGGECGLTINSFGSKYTKNRTVAELSQNGGTERNDFPWMIYITVMNGPIQRPCSGVILDDSWILTTASCIYAAYHETGNIVAMIGTYIQPVLPGNEGDNVPFPVRILKIFYHPRFDADRLGYDFALLQTNASLDFHWKDYMQPICLPTSRFECSTICDWENSKLKIVAGWLAYPESHDRAVISYSNRRTQLFGSLGSYKRRRPAVDFELENGVMSTKIPQRFGKATVQDPNNCLSSAADRTGFDNKSQICVKTTNEITMNSCLLYPGSPLMSVGELNNTGIRFWLCGLKSANPKAADGCNPSAGYYPETYSPFANICSVLDWINGRPITPTTTTTTMIPWWKKPRPGATTTMKHRSYESYFGSDYYVDD